jgi:hypothetical protein
MITFLNTCGIGLKGARNMKTAITIRIAYEILSRIAHIIIQRKLLGKMINLFFR